MKAKELWDYIENCCIKNENDTERVPKQLIKIKNREVTKVVRNGSLYKVFTKCGLGYSLYGTPEEALTYKFANALQKDFGLIEHITDKDYIVNSYHVDPREDIDAFLKLKIEGQYLDLSSGGAVSYIETSDMQKNPDAIVSVIQFMHDHIMYAEVNTKLDTCYNCGYQGELKMSKTENGDFRFTCPQCGCCDPDKQLITRRICGYMGVVNAGNVNKGRGDDIFHRVLHLDSENNIKKV